MSKLEDKLSASINKPQAAEEKQNVAASSKPAAKKAAVKKPAAKKPAAKKAGKKSSLPPASHSVLHPQRIWPD